MNKLEKVILDQHARVKVAGEDPLEALEEAKGEILNVDSVVEDTAELLSRSSLRCQYSDEPGSSRGYMRRAQNHDALVNYANGSLEWLKEVDSKTGIIMPGQGYLGGLALEYGVAVGVFGFAPRPYHLFEDEDPIQLAMGDIFYPPMIWAKALRAQAYLNRPRTMKELSPSEWLAESGLSLGSAPAKYGQILLGSTGFMPGRITIEAANMPEPIGDHIANEEVEAFRLSGFCDQAVVDPEFIKNPTNSMLQVIHLGGSLN